MYEEAILILECECGNKLEVLSHSHDENVSWVINLVNGVSAKCPCGRDFKVEVEVEANDGEG